MINIRISPVILVFHGTTTTTEGNDAGIVMLSGRFGRLKDGSEAPDFSKWNRM